MARTCFPTFLILGLAALITVTGCGQTDSASSAKAPAPNPIPNPSPPMPNATPGAAEAPVPAQFASARKVFDTHCNRCHTTQPGGGQGPGGPGFGGPKGMMMKGPNLAKVGADPKHTREWFVAFIRDPRSQTPKGRMPKFEGKISDSDLGALADYLGSLK